MHALVFDGDLIVTILQIITIDVLLGGDNAVVIALACRQLPPELRGKGIFWGTFGAIVLRIVLVFFALELLAFPYLRLAGSVLLLWIGIKLLLPEADDHAGIPASTHLLGAIRTVIVADTVMSLDNVVAIAGAANGHIGLVAAGILISVPIIVWGSQLVLRLMDRFPIVITFGAALLGWIAGEMVLDDRALAIRLGALPPWSHYAVPLAGALLVIGIGHTLAKHRQRRKIGR
ncbi:TerC family protein [Solimonas terrae]|uniref:TerC family protein n=1 Tax=Solimonas terrae TaxID=1396819 RepID=A0A6M2BQ28_9GAMM|nr:TerC family protein [Solimonas terrae]NGY04189.1 TerC family protein [Solimonas terrae]